jgi:hypothetical protein
MSIYPAHEVLADPSSYILFYEKMQVQFDSPTMGHDMSGATSLLPSAAARINANAGDQYHIRMQVLHVAARSTTILSI